MSEYFLPEGFHEELKQFERTTLDFVEGRLDAARYKPVRVPWGIYEQRENGHYMVRARLSGGDISPVQLTAIAGIAQKFSGKPLHLTTRGDVQIHNIAIKDAPEILFKLAEAGLSSRGGGGNTVRNITADWLSGYADDEAFDVSPYAGALTTRLIAENDSWALPRKYKIAFSGSFADRAFATVSDLGFIAVKNENGEKGFKVFVAGGMGRKPSPGILLHEFAPVCGIYDIARAIKNLFNKYGNRKNKHAARLRFLLEREGRESFIEKYNTELGLVKDENHQELEVGDNKIQGTYLEVPQFLGDLDLEEALLIAVKAGAFGEKSLRITPLQNIIVKDIPHIALLKTADEFKRLNLLKLPAPVIDSAAVCTGASTCRLGICLSRGLLTAVKDALKDIRTRIESVSDIKVKISGCPNSCGQHPVADIGLFGVVKRNGGHALPAYNILAGTRIDDSGARLAGHVGIIPAKAVPEFIRQALLETAAGRNKDEKFADYYDREGGNKLRDLAIKFSIVPDFSKAPEYYTDWSANRQFSATEKLEGECSAGLFDLIDLDFKESETSLKAALGGADTGENLRKSVASAARALLITKGLEAGSDAEAVLVFKDNFIGKHIPVSGAGPVNKYLTGSAIDAAEAENFLSTVRGLYLKMDDSLRLPEPSAETAAPGIETAEKRDFRGVKCPLNFVKTKLVLETLKSGALLEILLDDGEPVENVPASLLAEGHRILEKTKTGGYWKVLVQKGS
jgi:sulfite reductase (ferredoxin)